MAWTDESRAKAIQMYQDAEPTAANSAEICKEIADELDETANGVRMILSKAGVYIRKEEKKSSAGGASKSSGGTRVSKEQAHAALTSAIQAKGLEPDTEIISKLTGKAAQYFTSVLEGASSDDE